MYTRKKEKNEGEIYPAPVSLAPVFFLQEMKLYWNMVEELLYSWAGIRYFHLYLENYQANSKFNSKSSTTPAN